MKNRNQVAKAFVTKTDYDAIVLAKVAGKRHPTMRGGKNRSVRRDHDIADMAVAQARI